MPDIPRNNSFDPLDNNIDRIWAGNASDTSSRFNNYYDYYFSGEDVKIFIDGLFDPQDELDIASFAFSVRQEKQPLYGFWSYNHDAVMFGTRIISGEMAVFTRHPRRMTELLEAAAKNRALAAKNRQKDQVPSEYSSIISKLTPEGFTAEDEKNVQKYWAYSQLDRVTSDPGISDKNIFSAHPPFNFVILYNVEETALTPFMAAGKEEVNISDNLDRMIYSDVNQRTVRVDNMASPMKTIIQQVNLMNMTTSFASGGQALVEVYQFIARDLYHTSTDLSFIRNLVTVNESDSDTNESYTSSASTSYNGSRRSGES